MPTSSVNAIERPQASTESHFVLGAAFGQGGLTFEQESQKWEASDDEATEYYVYILRTPNKKVCQSMVNGLDCL